MDAAPPTPNELPHDHEISPELMGQLGGVELDVGPRFHELPHACDSKKGHALQSRNDSVNVVFIMQILLFKDTFLSLPFHSQS